MFVESNYEIHNNILFVHSNQKNGSFWNWKCQSLLSCYKNQVIIYNITNGVMIANAIFVINLLIVNIMC